MSVRRHSRWTKCRSSIPIKILNRFSPLSDVPTEEPDESALVIGDSIVMKVRIETPATILQYLPGARAPDILANLKVLTNIKRKLSKIVIQAGTNVKSSHLYLYGAFNNTDCVKALTVSNWRIECQ